MKPEWRTSTVVQMCQGMRETQDYSALPILADALQDADCDDEKLLEKMRGRLSEIEAQGLVACLYSEKTKNAVIWLESFAHANDVDSYEELMEAAKAYIEHEDYLIEGGRWEGHSVPDEFWDYYEAVVGIEPKWGEWNKRGSFFSCSC